MSDERILPRIGVFTTSDGYRLHYRNWQPRGAVLANLIALHGIQSHSGWYGWSSQRLAAAGYAVWFLDRRGSGMNEDRRGDAPHWSRLMHDVVQFADGLRWQTRTEPRPQVLMAVSWSGKLAAATVARHPGVCDALLLLYPGLKARIAATWWQQRQLALAERLGIRGKRVRIPLDDAALFTSNPRWQEYIRQDPLALREATVSFLLANRDLDRQVPAACREIRCPVHVALAEHDRIIDNPEVLKLVHTMPAAERHVTTYTGAAHTLEFEACREEFVAGILKWLSAASTLRRPREAT